MGVCARNRVRIWSHGRVREVCGQCFGTSRELSEWCQSAGHCQRRLALMKWTRERWDQTAFKLKDVRRLGPSLPLNISEVMDEMVTSTGKDHR